MYGSWLDRVYSSYPYDKRQSGRPDLPDGHL